ncbi:hypothetical protein ACFSVJ_01605 [Prauserella oleivorans]
MQPRHRQRLGIRRAPPQAQFTMGREPEITGDTAKIYIAVSAAGQSQELPGMPASKQDGEWCMGN